jgi:hypothetical protein
MAIKRKHARALTRFAGILNIQPPQLFLDWLLDMTIENLEDPGGTLGDWATDGMLRFDSKEEEEFVRARYVKWLKRKGVEPRLIEAYANPPDSESLVVVMREHRSEIQRGGAN